MISLTVTPDTTREDLDKFVDLNIETVTEAAKGQERWPYLVWCGEPKAHLSAGRLTLTFRGAFGGQ